MYQYAILRNTGHNEVYYKNSGKLAKAELSLLDLPISEVEEVEKAGLSYLHFSSDSSLTEDSLEKISRLSSLMGLFQEEGELLRPILLPDPQVFPRSMATMLKYQGKTNEIFTRFLLNLGFSLGGILPQNATILDPVAGRGTTLLEGFSLGANVYGMEQQEKAVNEGRQYAKKFLERGRYKHNSESIRVSGANKSFTAKRHSLVCQKQTFQIVEGDTKYCDQIFSKDFFHLIVGDLPYGVQHGNHAGGVSRSPAPLLSCALKSWHHVLKKNGVLVLSWNKLVLSREKMEGILQAKNFQILKNDALDQLEHEVDASILRDVIVAKKE